MLIISLILLDEIKRVYNADIPHFEKLELMADICRANTLATVKRAGSGHLGSSLSSLDIVISLYYSIMNITKLGIDHPDRDIYFSSKGHDVPSQYSVLYSLGLLSENQFINLRRLGGTHGHPDISIPGIEANTGSLGMGISKAKGMALAKHLSGNSGNVYVMTGDGELQEGQIWEAMQTTASQKVNNINVIVDFNKIQTDKPVCEIIDLGDIEKKFEIFGWHVERCNGHDYKSLEAVLAKFRYISDKPKVLIADTIKGKGISFMEGPTSLKKDGGLYKWHSGAPDDEYFESGYTEIISRLNDRLQKFGLAPVRLKEIESRKKGRTRLKDTTEKVLNAYGVALVNLGRERNDIIVLDADLSADCGLRPFEKTFPERFVENGIAEQDMVSMAGGLALQGFLPIVNSFGVFLASRANEQIYANATEKTKIIYVCHYSGLIPAGPGKSHQSLRDISLLGALPNFTIIEPCNSAETKATLKWCVNEAQENCMIRLAISPSPRIIELTYDYQLAIGEGSVLNEGIDAIIFGYGPVMLHEALLAAELLDKEGLYLKVVNMPWLNRTNKDWLIQVIGDCQKIFILDNHSSYGGLGDSLINTLVQSEAIGSRKIQKLGINAFPACGTPKEVLNHHKLDGKSLAMRILNI